MKTFLQAFLLSAFVIYCQSSSSEASGKSTTKKEFSNAASGESSQKPMFTVEAMSEPINNNQKNGALTENQESASENIVTQVSNAASALKDDVTNKTEEVYDKAKSTANNVVNQVSGKVNSAVQSNILIPVLSTVILIATASITKF